MSGSSGVGGHFAANVRRVRKRLGISQEALGFRAGLHRTEVGLLERGERVPRIDTLIKLAAGLEVEPGVLLEGIEWTEGETMTTPGGFSFAERAEVRERAAAFRARQSEVSDAVQLVREGRDELEARLDRQEERERRGR